MIEDKCAGSFNSPVLDDLTTFVMDHILNWLKHIGKQVLDNFCINP